MNGGNLFHTPHDSAVMLHKRTCDFIYARLLTLLKPATSACQASVFWLPAAALEVTSLQITEILSLANTDLGANHGIRY